MSLSSPFNTSPLGPHTGESDFSPPEHIRYWEPWPRRMRAVLAGQTVLDSVRGIVLWETGMFPAHYYPLDDLRKDLLEESADSEDGLRRWSVQAGDRLVGLHHGLAPGPRWRGTAAWLRHLLPGTRPAGRSQGDGLLVRGRRAPGGVATGSLPPGRCPLLFPPRRRPPPRPAGRRVGPST